MNSCRNCVLFTKINPSPHEVSNRILYRYDGDAGQIIQASLRFRDIEEQAINGCNACSVLCEGYRLCRGDDRLHAWNMRRESLQLTIRASLGGPMSVTITGRARKENFYDYTHSKFQVCSLENTHHPWPCLTRISSRPLDFLTPERLTLFQNWIRTCREGHPNCKNSGDTATPKRLLRVERSKNWELSLDEDIQQNPSYVTLSHRWNVSLADSIKTTRDNIAERRSKISWEVLPKTIQDAITVTRSLGVSHLWIDSLCIIQDDSQDRNEQIARMGDIYAGSLVTLASHSDPSESGSSADGLFLNRKHVQDVVQLDHEGNTFSTYIVDQTFHNIIMPGSLTSRAWSLQERLLSPRVLHFRKGETIFECFSSSRCECKPDGFPKDADVHLPVEVWSQNRHIDTTLKLDMANGILHAKDHNEERCWSYWHRVIAAYTGADLTRVEDTLPTLSGIAHRMPRELFGRYIAGLWTNKLPYELLWQHDNGCGRKRSRYVPYVAPSWSWTCLSGTSRLDYHWFDSEVVRVAEVLHADTTLASHDPMGAVTAGFINVKAHAKLVKPSQFGYWDDIKSTILYDGWWI